MAVFDSIILDYAHSKEKNGMEKPKTVLSLSSSEMIAEATKHLGFLKGLHSTGITLMRPSLASLDRYLNLWLPLVFKSINEETKVPLIPPADVAWLWHCHRLAPARYEKHVKNRFHQMVETPSYAFQFQCEDDTRDTAIKTREYWSQAYPDSNFFCNSDYQPCSDEEAVDLDEFLNDFDLLTSATRQAKFLWHVSGPSYSNPAFLAEAVENYIKFLELFGMRRSLSMTPLVPTYPIDLMWHTHMLKSLEIYNNDCIRIAGRRFNHDDSFDDREEGGALDISFQRTSRLWQIAYGVEYSVEGGMYQGEPPEEYWDPNWTPNNLPESTTMDDRTFRLLAGSLSAGKTPSSEDSIDDDRVPMEWLPCDPSISFEGSPTFIPGGPGQEGLEKYVYGVPVHRQTFSRGPGYYHIYTREGWSLLLQKLDRKLTNLESDMEWYLCSRCVCSEASLTPYQKAQFKNKADQCKELTEHVNYAWARFDSPGPGAGLSPEIISKYGFSERVGRDKHSAWNSAVGAGAYDASFHQHGAHLHHQALMDAAGCGGDGGGGGGCVGGACGGGACGGGAGCGGGGCGGGGCGGGCGGG